MGSATLELILTEDVQKLGNTGALVKVKPGYARNFLLPKGLAVVADAANMEIYEQKKAELEEEARRRKEKAEEAKQILEESNSITIQSRSGESGKLFGAITKDDIAKAIKEQIKVEVDKQKVKIKNPIKALGEFHVQVGLNAGLEAEVIVKVESI